MIPCMVSFFENVEIFIQVFGCSNTKSDPIFDIYGIKNLGITSKYL